MPRLFPIYSTVAIFFGLWTLWVLILLQFPALNSGETVPSLLRALVRLVLWLGPIAVYARVVEKLSFLALFEFQEDLRRGLVGGALIFTATAILALLRYTLLGHDATDPRAYSLNTWINPLLLAPIVEELLFRGFLYRKLAPLHGRWPAILITSALFALIHFPYWFLSGSMTGLPLLTSFTTIFLIGAALALVQHFARNVIAPIFGHLGNNFFSGLVP